MEGSIAYFLALIHTLYIISAASFQVKAHWHIRPCSCRREVNPVEFLVVFYTNIPKDCGEAKQNC